MNAITSTWHAGERAAQTRAGTAEHMAAIGPKVVRDFMPDQHRAFFEQLPFLVIGSLDAERRPWASILAGLGYRNVYSLDGGTLGWLATKR